MKKLFIAAVALVAAVFTSCSNEDLNIENNEVKVNFTVAEKVGFDNVSRSVKTGWDNGDEILIVFKDEDGFWLDFTNNANTLKLTRTDGEWIADDSNITISSLNGTGYKACYYPGSVSFASELTDGLLYFEGYNGGEYLMAEGNYTVNGSEIDLGTITMTRDEYLFQISVKGLASEAGEWTLTIQTSSGSEFYYKHLQKGIIRTTTISGNITSQNVYEKAGGVKYADDVQFCFIKNTGSYQAPGKFVLSNGTKTYELEKSLTSASLQGGCAYSLPAITEWTELAQ